MVREEYTSSYEKATTTAGDKSSDASSAAGKCAGMSEFANISIDPKMVAKRSEIDDYLHSPVENAADPLKWWYDKRRVYPNLSRMALDYLSIPRTCSSILCSDLPDT